MYVYLGLTIVIINESVEVLPIITHRTLKSGVAQYDAAQSLFVLEICVPPFPTTFCYVICRVHCFGAPNSNAFMVVLPSIIHTELQPVAAQYHSALVHTMKGVCSSLFFFAVCPSAGLRSVSPIYFAYCISATAVLIKQRCYMLLVSNLTLFSSLKWVWFDACSLQWWCCGIGARGNTQACGVFCDAAHLSKATGVLRLACLAMFMIFWVLAVLFNPLHLIARSALMSRSTAGCCSCKFSLQFWDVAVFELAACCHMFGRGASKLQLSSLLSAKHGMSSSLGMLCSVHDVGL